MGNQISNRVNSLTPHAFASDHPLRWIEYNFPIKLPDTSDIWNGSGIVKITQEDSNGQEILSHHLSCS
jgi:hypothetical protein